MASELLDESAYALWRITFGLRQHELVSNEVLGASESDQ